MDDFFSKIMTTVSFSSLIGFILSNCGYPAMLGYMLSGCVMTYVGGGIYNINTLLGESNIIMLQEIALITLMFVTGLKTNLSRFFQISKQALKFVLMQVIFSIITIICIYQLYGKEIIIRIIFMLFLTLNSTAAAVNILENFNKLNTLKGSFIVCILIIQDVIFMITIAMLKNTIAGVSPLVMIGNLCLVLSLLCGIVIFLRSRFVYGLSKILHKFVNRNFEIVCTIVITLLIIVGSILELLSISASLGGFILGLILGNIGEEKKFYASIAPFNAIMMLLFFVVIGSKLDLNFILQHSIIVWSCTILIVAHKIGMNWWIANILCIEDSLSIAFILSQLSEFGFILVIFINQIETDTFLSIFMENMIIISLSIGSLFTIVSKSYLYKKGIM